MWVQSTLNPESLYPESELWDADDNGGGLSERQALPAGGWPGRWSACARRAVLQREGPRAAAPTVAVEAVTRAPSVRSAAGRRWLAWSGSGETARCEG